MNILDFLNKLLRVIFEALTVLYIKLMNFFLLEATGNTEGDETTVTVNKKGPH